jgi:prephenate dehydrogenase
MDVGSTKGNVVDAARRVLKERLKSFVPAHPIAGREVAGIAHADATLYQDCQVVLTPVVETDIALIERARAAWMGIGAQVRTMTPEAHDAAFASVSHLPHLLAFSAYLAVAHQPEGKLFLELAGPGFRDFTRIAASDAAVWRDILLANRAQVLAQAEQFKSTLFQFEAAMREGQADVIEKLIKEAAQGRGSWQPTGARDSS